MNPKSTKRKAAAAPRSREVFTPETYFQNPKGNWMLVREYPPATKLSSRLIASEQTQSAMRTFEGLVLAVGPRVKDFVAGDVVSWQPHDGSSNGHLQSIMEAGMIQWLRDDQVISTVGHAARQAWIDSRHQDELDRESSASDAISRERAALIDSDEDDGMDPALPPA